MMSVDEDHIDEFSLMFECARSLIGGVKIIKDSDGTNEGGVTKHPTIPMIVCSAFAIEILLKALLKKSDIPFPRVHDLELLFKKLPIELQDTLFQHQVTHTNLAPAAAAKLLLRHKDTFENWRYPYEDHLEELTATPSFLYGFALSLSDHIEAHFPVERSMNGWVVKEPVEG